MWGVKTRNDKSRMRGPRAGQFLVPGPADVETPVSSPAFFLTVQRRSGVWYSKRGRSHGGHQPVDHAVLGNRECQNPPEGVHDALLVL